MAQPGSAASAVQVHTENSGETTTWQRRLLPFMACMIVILATLAGISNFYQATVMQRYIATVRELDLKPAWDPVTFDNASTFQDRLASAQWRTLALLESQALHNRYHQASVILMGRVYIIFIGFTTGVVMALIGAAFILGKLQEPVSSVNSGAGEWQFAIRSSSPGVILAVLGTVLILATIWARSEVSVRDATLYIPARLAGMPVPGSAAKSAKDVENDILNSVQQAEDAKKK